MIQKNAGRLLPLRPHHVLCLSFFTGYGYSSGFVENMFHIRRLLWENPKQCILLCRGSDCICAGCPNHRGKLCRTGEKAERYDAEVLKACGFSFGQVLSFHKLRQAATLKILNRPGTRNAICNDCLWNSFCQHLPVEKSVENV